MSQCFSADVGPHSNDKIRADAIIEREGTIGQARRAANRPRKAAGHDDLLLPFSIGEQGPSDQSLPGPYATSRGDRG